MKQQDSETIRRIWLGSEGYTCKQVLGAFMPGRHYYFILGMDTFRYEWIGDTLKDVTGFDKGEWDVLTMLDRIHPDDQPWVKAMEEKLTDFAETNGTEWLSGYTIVCDYRLRHVSGNYIRLLIQMIQIDEGPGLTKRYGIAADITHIKASGDPTLSLVGINGRESFFNVLMKPSQPVSCPFSAREREVVLLLMQGRSSSEIAQELHLALNTVKKHKSNIFAKTGCNTSLQLLKKCITSMWILPSEMVRKE